MNNTNPLRNTVRVIIKHRRLVCVCFDKQNHSYKFPGGGIEEGQTIEQAAIQECLEEAGLRIKNVVELDYVSDVIHTLKVGDRSKYFSGTRSIYVVADFDKSDDSIFNSQGDGMSTRWITPEGAIKLFTTNGGNVSFNNARIEAVKKAFNI